MENFTNNELDVRGLPKFESVELQRLEPKYRRVLAVNIGLALFVELIVLLILTLKPEELSSMDVLFFWLGGALIGLLIVWLTLLGFRKKGYAFREHDLIFQYGVIATSTKIIPYNRVQHVALHRGFISRKFNLATVQLFTAGENSADLKIPGILYEDAVKIKELVSNKINLQHQIISVSNSNE